MKNSTYYFNEETIEYFHSRSYEIEDTEEIEETPSGKIELKDEEKEEMFGGRRRRRTRKSRRKSRKTSRKARRSKRRTRRRRRSRK